MSAPAFAFVEKSPEAFRSISEAATDLDLPQHVLRFWESRFTQIRPLKRGGGRRYYRPEDVGLLKRIRDLLYQEGYTIKGVQKVLRDHAGRPPRDPAMLDAHIAAALAAEEALAEAMRLDGEDPCEANELVVDGVVVDGVVVDGVVAAAAPRAAVAVARGELADLLAELEDLRDILQRALR